MPCEGAALNTTLRSPYGLSAPSQHPCPFPAAQPQDRSLISV
jgi:hypothetical protein